MLLISRLGALLIQSVQAVLLGRGVIYAMVTQGQGVGRSRICLLGLGVVILLARLLMSMFCKVVMVVAMLILLARLLIQSNGAVSRVAWSILAIQVTQGLGVGRSRVSLVGLGLVRLGGGEGRG